ncbi:AbrB family transcriptional regulator [Celeribacter sp. PS-C1]|uniref:AbrB family transcriptional regulator n=1 Tax=Celeribacter sp. PS-C1 TaxID=2820813 RepID=UPI002104C2C1|nr:AbrB family transcriptional regulator [Celeribacter sp. PS-C1]
MRTRLRNWAFLAGLYAVAAAGGYLFSRFNLPLPWMIGPMIVTALLTFTGLSTIVVPVSTRPYGQATVASQVALFFTPSAFQALVMNVPLLVGMALLICVVAFFVGFVLSKFARIPLANALIAVLPTSPVEAATTAEHHGFDPAPIILAQIIRISTVVIAVPMIIYLLYGHSDQNVRRIATDSSLIEIVTLALLAWVGVIAFKRLKISNPYFMGPLALVAFLNVVGVPLTPFPSWILQIAQIILGTWLGSTFRRSLFTSAKSYTKVAVLCSMLFVATCGLTGAMVAYLFDLPLSLMLLASAPGGVTEMALTAKVLGIDVSLITAFHLTRLFIIMPNITWVIAAVARRSDRHADGDD